MSYERYKAVRENDGTYSIRASVFGLNWTVIRLGVRGCNVNRVIGGLYARQ
jgi:hypothetical protein